MRLRKNPNRGLISDARHERLKQPDRGCSVSNSKMTAKANKQQQNSTSVFKKGGKVRTSLLFKEYSPLVQNRLCFTFLFLSRAKSRLYQTSIWHVVHLCNINACLQPNTAKQNLLPHIPFLSAGHYSSFAYNLYNKMVLGELYSVS